MKCISSHISLSTLIPLLLVLLLLLQSSVSSSSSSSSSSSPSRNDKNHHQHHHHSHHHHAHNNKNKKNKNKKSKKKKKSHRVLSCGSTPAECEDYIRSLQTQLNEMNDKHEKCEREKKTARDEHLGNFSKILGVRCCCYYWTDPHLSDLVSSRSHLLSCDLLFSVSCLLSILSVLLV